MAHRQGVQFPVSVPILDDFTHGISENPKLVNTQFLKQTDTIQFEKWLGKSKAVNKGGIPIVI